MSPPRSAPLLACCLAAAACAGPSGSPTTSRDGGAAITASTSAPPTTTSWPDLPRTSDAAAALLRAHTLRDDTGVTDAAIEADALLARASATGWGRLIAGEARITAWLQAFLDRATAAGRDAVLLWGTYHDAPGQVDAFRRLVGPSGLRGLTLIAAEQLRKTGAWGSVPGEAQRGDDDAIAAWIGRGDRAAFDHLTRTHHEVDYAAWKFGYEPVVIDLLVTARAAAASPNPGDPKLTMIGCDMPKPLQAHLAELPDDARLRLRELHCALALQAAPPPRRAALLWGRAHVRAHALPRFLPPSTSVLSVYVVGYRSEPWTTEAQLRDHLALVDPILIPLDEGAREVAIVYPDAALAASIDRARDDGERAASTGLHVRIEGGGKLLLGDRTIPVNAGDPRTLPAVGEATWAVEQGGIHVVGALDAHPTVSIELTVDPKRRHVTTLERRAP